MVMGKQLVDEIESFEPSPGRIGLWWLGQLGYIVKSTDSILSCPNCRDIAPTNAHLDR